MNPPGAAGLNDNSPRPRAINSPRLRLGLLIALGRGELSINPAAPGGFMQQRQHVPSGKYFFEKVKYCLYFLRLSLRN